MTKIEQKKELRRIRHFMFKYFPVANWPGVLIQLGGTNKYKLVLFSSN